MKSTGLPAPIYFGGKVKEPVWKPLSEQLQTTQIFLHYINTVWVNEHQAPTDRADLARFDTNALIPEYQAFLQGGGKIPERGASLEEFWLGCQLSFRGPLTCLLNTAQPEQDVGRITRLQRMSAKEIWDELQMIYANPALDRPHPAMTTGLNPISTVVYDGDEVAHIVLSWTIHKKELHFADPWPGRSLLCEEHNSAGVAARESNLIQHGWRITRPEFERMVFAVFLHKLTSLPSRPVVELTEDERQAAEQQKSLRNVLGMINRPRAKPIKGMKTISRLEFAVRFNRVWEVKVSINEGHDLNERGENGATVLHIAAEKGYLEIVKLLAEHGADCHIRDANGKTPAEIAIAKGNSAVAQYLQSLG